MVFKIIWSPSALRDLREIVAYIRPHNQAAARTFGQRIIDKAESLSTHPERGRVIRKFQNPSIREIFISSYRIAYRINQPATLVEIARIWHGARNEENFEL